MKVSDLMDALERGDRSMEHLGDKEKEPDHSAMAGQIRYMGVGQLSSYLGAAGQIYGTSLSDKMFGLSSKLL